MQHILSTMLSLSFNNGRNLCFDIQLWVFLCKPRTITNRCAQLTYTSLTSSDYNLLHVLNNADTDTNRACNFCLPETMICMPIL